MRGVAALLVLAGGRSAAPYAPPSPLTPPRGSATALFASAPPTAPPSLADSVSGLKRVLEREYASFFDPMRREYYAPDVTFLDPMTTLAGVDAYQGNVDMLASRTLLGKVLFEDAGIVLHGVEGGEISEDGSEVSDLLTRWTLRLTAKVIPWRPTARFTGVSIYRVEADPSSEVGVQIMGQTDYWDSVNIKPGSGGDYGPVDKGRAISDFLDQLRPGGMVAVSAAPELPYQLLRRGDGYEVRSYPAYSGVRIPYTRRDEGFGSLGAFTSGEAPILFLSFPAPPPPRISFPCDDLAHRG